MLATQRGSILHNFGRVGVFPAICLIRLHQYISYKNAIISKGIKIIPSYFNFAKSLQISSFPNIWTSIMHIVRHRVQLGITSSILEHTFQVKMRHLRLLSPPLVNQLQGVLLYRATLPHLPLHAMNYNNKEFSNYSGFIKIAKKKKTVNFIEFFKSLLKII